MLSLASDFSDMPHGSQRDGFVKHGVFTLPETVTVSSYWADVDMIINAMI